MSKSLLLFWSFLFVFLEFVFAQVLREAIRFSLPHAKFVVDRAPVGDIAHTSLATTYVDNCYHFSPSRKIAESDARTVEKYLNNVGLATHEETIARSTCIVSGREMNGDGLVLRPKASSVGLLSAGLLVVEKGRPVSGKQIEHIVGH